MPKYFTYLIFAPMFNEFAVSKRTIFRAFDANHTNYGDRRCKFLWDFFNSNKKRSRLHSLLYHLTNDTVCSLIVKMPLKAIYCIF